MASEVMIWQTLEKSKNQLVTDYHLPHQMKPISEQCVVRLWVHGVIDGLALSYVKQIFAFETYKLG